MRAPPTTLPTPVDAVTALVQQLREAGRDLPSALRVARHLVLERLAVLDVEQAAPLDTVTGAMTDLAEATLELASGEGGLGLPQPLLACLGNRALGLIVGRLERRFRRNFPALTAPTNFF